MKKIAMTMMVIGLTAMVAQASVVHFSFDETAPGSWDVNVTVNYADTLGLAQYSIWVRGTNAVSYVENQMHTLRPGDFAQMGFQPQFRLQGPIGPDFNAGNFQRADEYAIHNIGVTPLQIGPPPPFPAPPPYDIDLGVPAHIGTFTTPAGLGLPAGSQEGHDDFSASANLLNEPSDGIIHAITTWEVNPIPEPATLSLLSVGSLLLIRRKRRLIRKVCRRGWAVGKDLPAGKDPPR